MKFNPNNLDLLKPENRNYAKLFPPEDFSVALCLAIYESVCLKGLYPVQVQEMKKAWLAGFAECFKVFFDYSEMLTEENAASLFQRLTDECGVIVDSLLKEQRKK